MTRPPGETFYGGYAGYFADPDGHAWEIAFNPGFALAADGFISVPDFGSAVAGAGRRVAAAVG